MASTRKRTTKEGQIFYEIRVSRGRRKSYLTTRWYPPEGWSKKLLNVRSLRKPLNLSAAVTKARSLAAPSKEKATSSKSGRPPRS